MLYPTRVGLTDVVSRDVFETIDNPVNSAMTICACFMAMT